jgi:subtilase family serine protease
MRLLHRSLAAGITVVTGIALTALAGSFSTTAVAATPARGPSYVAIKGSQLVANSGRPTGAYHSSRMSVEVALAPGDQAGLSRQLQAIYTRGTSAYHHWLARGQFDARFAPSAAERAAVMRYLRSAGLRVSAGSSPFLIRATGSSRQVQAAFRTTLSTYAAASGERYFANSTPARLPAALAGGTLGIIGLTNTVREHSQIVRRPGSSRLGADRAPGVRSASSSSGAGCETGYVTESELFNYVNYDAPIPYGYGAGPGCTGLSPSQTNSVYGAPSVGSNGKGAGVDMGLFELSAYQESDIDTFAHYFYGPSYSPSLVNINVDGGPLHPICPAGDECPADINYYSGDIEVDADIEMSMTISPDNSHILVYNAPNDYTGQTSLDEYNKIANQDTAAVVSSSWGVCEDEITAGYAEAENVIFEQMAMQGQSLFNAFGDSGAYGCLPSPTYADAGDPADQPWVTGVGGTSFESYNPGTDPTATYPSGVETVWNSYNLCSEQPANRGNDDQGGLFWCLETGAGGGAPSQWWGRPSYQQGPGVSSPYSTYGNGSTDCALAAAGTPCREGPDISANADPFTGPAEYCTGNSGTPYSDCASFESTDPVPGWFQIGGTSLSSPLWSAIFADRDSYTGQRAGNANPLLYSLFDTDPGQYFHDITGVGPLQRIADNNGLYPSTPGYDMATGIGTPRMAALITGG